MKVEKFQTLLEELEKLTPHQREFLEKHLDKSDQAHLVNTLIENRARVTPICPKCGHNQIARWGLASGLQRYRCATCKITFNALTGTPLYSS